MAENLTVTKNAEDAHNAKMREEFMRATDKASMIGSISRFFGYIGGLASTALMISTGFVFSESINIFKDGIAKAAIDAAKEAATSPLAEEALKEIGKAAITEAGAGAALTAGFAGLSASTLILTLLAVGLVFIVANIALDYYSGRIFREKGLDQTELNATRTAHHLVKGVSQAQHVEKTDQPETAPPQRRDGKTWLQAVSDLSEQKAVANAR